MNIDMSLVMACLGIMAKGMLGIFVVILVIWALVALLNKSTGERKAASVTAAPVAAAPAADTGKRQEVVAAVSAAVAEELGEEVSAIRITSFRKIG